jgi:hypothetical protein
VCEQLLRKRGIYSHMTQHPDAWSGSDDPQRFESYRGEAERSLGHVEDELRAYGCPT